MQIREYEHAMDDWEGHCQVLLQALAGYNHRTFYSYVHVRII
jgi:hypothetical protein